MFRKKNSQNKNIFRKSIFNRMFLLYFCIYNSVTTSTIFSIRGESLVTN